MIALRRIGAELQNGKRSSSHGRGPPQRGWPAASFRAVDPRGGQWSTGLTQSCAPTPSQHRPIRAAAAADMVQDREFLALLWSAPMFDALAPALDPQPGPAPARHPARAIPRLDAAYPQASLPAGFEPMARFERPLCTEGEAAVPFVFASPHSGRIYPDGFLNASRLDPITLRQSEDAFVDDLFAAAPQHGAAFLKAHFPRAFVDVNREPWELDPSMFAEPLPAWCNTRSIKVVAGLGTLARVIRDGKDIYASRLALAEAEHRIASLYMPYHRTLEDLLDGAMASFGCAVLVDCHSMPSVGGPMDRDRGTSRCDFVLGDRYGTACSPLLTRIAAETLRSMGYRVGRNAPYAGGFCTLRHGAPSRGRHALQIEVNRGLYMDEATLTPRPDFPTIAADLGRLIARLTAIAPEMLRCPPTYGA